MLQTALPSGGFIGSIYKNSKDEMIQMSSLFQKWREREYLLTHSEMIIA